MNNLQAQDAIRRAKEQEDVGFERSRELYQQAHPNEGVAASSPLSYQRYTEDFAPYTQTDDQGVETAMTGDPMSEQDFLNRQIARQRLAGDTSAAADAQYKSETVDDRIAMIEAQAETMPAELQAKGASAEVTTAYMQELGRQIQITRENAPDTPQGKTKQGAAKYQSALTAVENLHKLYKGTSGGGGFSSYGAQGFINAELEQGITQSQQSDAIVGEEGGQQLMAPRQTHVEGEYQK
jgi:polyhydroxyalkanoate synthesis regulator phasin